MMSFFNTEDTENERRGHRDQPGLTSLFSAASSFLSVASVFKKANRDPRWVNAV